METRYRLTEAEAGLAHADTAAETPPGVRLDRVIDHAEAGLLADQHSDGHWCYELEADCTIPAEYIMMNHFMDELEPELERKLGNYIRSRQSAEHDGWPLFHGGDFDLSCSVKAYFALKLIGDSPDAPHMQRAREAILAHGGAARCNVFTRIALALFEQIPWRGTPFVPVEQMLLPRWFPFHISKVSYWSRTVMIPLSILCSYKPRAANPRRVDIRELFTIPPEEEKHYFRPDTLLGQVFRIWDIVARTFEPLIPRFIRQHATRKSEAWFIERLNGVDGLGAIFPAMVNAYEALALLGYPADHPYRVEQREAIRRLLIIDDEADYAYCQPCVSPVWDTAWAAFALTESGCTNSDAIRQSLDWLAERQLSDEPGDWQDNHPDLAGGGWAFQYRNDHYPDLDDTPAVAWAMHYFDADRYRENIERAGDWICGMQSRNGGYGAFDSDNTCHYLNYIPFADHGALLDPPTSDVTGRCVIQLSLLDKPEYRPARRRAIEFLKNEQEANGSWFGRWGTNYIYGTWSVLTALEVAGEDMQQNYIRRAVDWLKSIQHDDGGWGEGNDTYHDPDGIGAPHPSTPYQTGWALLALMAAGEAGSDSVRRGIEYLVQHQQNDGLWSDDSFTAPGFPRVFYLKYHGYAKIFPFWALARYRTLLGRDETATFPESELPLPQSAV
ncbi:squalene-hopene/tetraprenyl-beta-curcumene cyclase [Methylohalomonas lacus]|uniref:Squalene-hopene/tetraprenyl-beta-curcumene cyclase n=1 Tax=Methylohalomonas lacus TaxID=398773 RepID=A0AAE3HIF0_9GAMM|nr:squalene-hopene/tetraprenyl-beta-curcumene cyclase [Methylohalomonas lacus]